MRVIISLTNIDLLNTVIYFFLLFTFIIGLPFKFYLKCRLHENYFRSFMAVVNII